VATDAASAAGAAAASVTAGPAAAAAASSVQLQLPGNTVNSLAALLEELVSAAQAVLDLDCFKAPENHSSAAAAAAAAARQQLQAHHLSDSVVAIVGALWGSSTVGSSQLVASGLIQPGNRAQCLNSSSSTTTTTSSSSASGAAGMFGDVPGAVTGPAEATTAPAAHAEGLAARLLLFVTAWVLAGQCKQPERQLPMLQNTLAAVISGAGFTWALPPPELGFFGGRPSLSTGKWVSWTQDCAAYSNASGCGSMGTAGLGLALSRISGAGDRPSHSPAFACSPQICALQCFVHWVLKAGMSPVLLAEAGAGVSTAVRQLLRSAWAQVQPQPALASYTADPLGSTGYDRLRQVLKAQYGSSPAVLVLLDSAIATGAAAAAAVWSGARNLFFNTSCIPVAVQVANSSNSSTSSRAGGLRSQQQHPSHALGLPRPLIQPSVVAGVVFAHWGPLLPNVPLVPRQQLLLALQSIWLDLPAAVAGLRSLQLLPSTAACAFDTRHFRSTLATLVSLCERAAAQCGASAGRQQQVLQQLQGVFTVPPTPGAGLQAVTPGACVTPHRLCGNKVPFKTLCLLVVEVLSRYVSCT
jgi:hypothetical protein